MAEKFENRYDNMESKLNTQNTIYDDQLRGIYTVIEEKLPEEMEAMRREMNSWKRVMDQQDREVAELNNRQRKDTQKLMNYTKTSFQQQAGKIETLLG